MEQKLKSCAVFLPFKIDRKTKRRNIMPNQEFFLINSFAQVFLMRFVSISNDRFRREKQLPGYKPRKCGNLLKRSGEKPSRKRTAANIPPTMLSPTQQSHAPTPFPTGTQVVPGESTTPSPTSAPNTPMKATLYAQLDGTNNSPKSVVIIPPGVVTSGSNSAGRTKKFRHRRVGSGTFNSPKSSPSRDRRVQSEPETRHVKLVDTETQTDAMDISETDASPSPNLASKRMSTSLREEADLEGRLQRDPNTDLSPTQRPQTPPPQGYRCGKPQSEDDGEVPEDEENGNSISTPMTNSRSSDMLTSSNHQQHHSPLRDLDDEDEGEDRGVCSSPDPIMDVMNSNERLDRDCSDDDKIDTLNRKVSFISEKLQQQSVSAGGVGGGGHVQQLTDYSNILNDNNVIVYRANKMLNGSFGKGSNRVDGGGAILMKHPTAGSNLNAGGSAVGAYMYSGNGVVDDHHLARQNDEQCNDSWTDEEGEDPIELYNYALRRKR